MGSLLAVDGKTLLENCQWAIKVADGDNPEETLKFVLFVTSCISYVDGVVDTDAIWYQREGRLLYCLPEDFTQSQLLRVIVRYLENNPAQLHYPAAALVHLALREGFPCIGR